ncbi:acid sphingomyelinase-like phosphodiesterase 3b [Oratosquilla oratoria]|uniref:acid sphingomyelinase-like phosphodiesterase 3b n=1 Tax=Oratosquilla oratoria TaxID=337810 RepID=UPI003F7738D6
MAGNSVGGRMMLRLWCLCFVINGVQMRTGTFWHVSDFHLDTNYTQRGDAQAMCWARGTYKSGAPLEANFSASGPSSSSPGKFGDFLCDAPYTLVLSALKAMKTILPKPDFVLWTGDDTAHVEDKYISRKKVLDIVRNLTESLSSSFEGVPVIPVLGNHDYSPKNQMPVGTSDFQTAVADMWRPWLNESQYSLFKQGGYYAVDVPNTNLTVVALNTLVWYKNNNATALDPAAQDPAGQFQWAEEQLKGLARRGRKAFLIGHIPPGLFERFYQSEEGFYWYQPRYNEQFNKLVANHADVITGQFFAHHHTDAFKVFYNDARKPVGFQLLVPGVTPWKSSLAPETGANNPGVRLVTYDTVTAKILEVSTYYLNLTKANLKQEDQWELEYNMTSYFDLQAVSASEFDRLAQNMKKNATVFNKYYSVNTVQFEKGTSTSCDEKCRRVHYCAAVEVDYNRFRSCNGRSDASSLAASLKMIMSLVGIVRMAGVWWWA